MAEVNEGHTEVQEVLFSRCSVGKNKWLWAAWLYDELLGGHPPFAYGYKTTSSAAEETARQTLGSRFPLSPSFQGIAGHAEHWRRRLASEKKAQQISDGSTAVPMEFLYCDWTSDYDGETKSAAHRILKKTAKKVFVDAESNSFHHTLYGDWRDFAWRRTYALDRAKLERDGRVYTHQDAFYSKPIEERQHDYVPSFYEALGLTSPCPASQVKQAWRKLVRSVHPDSGGSSEEFNRLSNAYAKAMDYSRRHFPEEVDLECQSASSPSISS